MSVATVYEMKFNQVYYSLLISRLKYLHARVDSLDGVGGIINRISSDTNSTIVIINGSSGINDDSIVTGAYHTVSDSTHHDVVASPIAPLNFLMHVFCTDQVDIIKDRFIPRSLFKGNARVENVVLIIIMKGDHLNLAHIINDLKNDLILPELESVDIPSHEVKKKVVPDLNAIKTAQQALFSLMLQSKR